MQTGLSGNMRNCKYLLEQEYVPHIQESMNDFILLERQESKKRRKSSKGTAHHLFKNVEIVGSWREEQRVDRCYSSTFFWSIRRQLTFVHAILQASLWEQKIPQKTEMVSPWLPMHTYLVFIVFHRHCVVYKLKVCGNSVKRVSWLHIANSICSLHVSVSHFGISCNLSNFFSIIIFVRVICNQWSWCCYFNCFRKQFTTNQVTLMVKYPPANAGDARDMGSVFGSGRTPGAGNCNPLQYSCLENPLDRGDWWATVRGVAWLKRLSTHTHMHFSRLNWNW